MNKISAEIIADSINSNGNRLTTFLVVFPRIVLAEFNTHRMLSRNSASSRAIPFEKMLDRLETEPFIPIKFQKDHKGMQGTEYFEDEELETAKTFWLAARNNAVNVAKAMSLAGITKQLCNRLLEPFMYHTVIVTASDWENFFSLRAHGAAEIHIQDLAHKMLDAYNESAPEVLKAGEFHIPFGDKMQDMRIHKELRKQFEGRIPEPNETVDNPVPQPEYAKAFEQVKIKIAVARCARLSYLNYEGTDDYNKDIELHDNLSKMGHWSPFEHVAKSMSSDEYSNESETKKAWTGDYKPEMQAGWSGNFRGFIQYRKTWEGENATDGRVEK